MNTKEHTGHVTDKVVKTFIIRLESKKKCQSLKSITTLFNPSSKNRKKIVQQQAHVMTQ